MFLPEYGAHRHNLRNDLIRLPAIGSLKMIGSLKTQKCITCLSIFTATVGRCHPQLHYQPHKI